MLNKSILLIIILSITAPMHAQEINEKQIKPELGSLHLHSDWVVGCDNVRNCSAVSLKPEAGPHDSPNISIAKNIGEKPFLHIDIYNLDKPSDDYQILIDGNNIAVAIYKLEDETLRITGNDAAILAQAMATGYSMKLISADSDELTISLAGTMASLLYIDDQQKTYNTKAALVSRGNKVYDVTFNPSKITVNKIGKLYDVPDVKDIIGLSRSSGCDELQYGVSNDRVFSMGKQDDKPIALVIISCGNGAYNFSAALYVGRLEDEKWSFKPADFDYDDAVFTSENGAKVLVNVNWDKDQQVLSSFQKGRGLGDCGTSADYVWDGDEFRLVSATAMDPCRGAWRWISLWQAKPIYKQ